MVFVIEFNFRVLFFRSVASFLILMKIKICPIKDFFLLQKFFKKTFADKKIANSNFMAPYFYPCMNFRLSCIVCCVIRTNSKFQTLCSVLTLYPNISLISMILDIFCFLRSI